MSKKSQNKNFEFCASKHVLFLYQLTIKCQYNKSVSFNIYLEKLVWTSVVTIFDNSLHLNYAQYIGSIIKDKVEGCTVAETRRNKFSLSHTYNTCNGSVEVT
jgi:hypothetical protein